MGFGGIFKSAAKKFTKTGRKVGKLQRSLANRERKHQIASLKENIRAQGVEDIRQQAGLKQSGFARGLGKSTIAAQDKERLDLIQSNRAAQMNRQLDLAERGKALGDTINRFNKRTGWADTLDTFSDLGMSAFGAYSAGAGAGFWGGDESSVGAFGPSMGDVFAGAKKAAGG